MLIYVKGLIGKLFKILPLRENEEKSLNEYLDSLWMEMSGAYMTFPILQESSEYVSALNIVGYLTTHSVSPKQCKREVFKAIGLVEKLSIQAGGDADD
ncbi:hypothetical protein SDC9_41240 [bioreactor metagenome]|uniref:Uncharacterized protein n=1 Tax=bioreactor metagenome TaxID=1076179 RepID=A0A644VUY0_9ZZZZ